MKKVWKIYLWSWVVYIAIVIFGSIAILTTTQKGTEHHKYLVKLSESPEYIEKVIKVDLPNIAQIDSDYGVGSSWTSYGYDLKFSEALLEDCIRELNKLCETDSIHWKKFEDRFMYTESASLNYDISCIIYNDHSVVDYGICDELPTSLLVFLASTTIILYILIAWGIIHLIISVIRKIIRKMKN